MRVHGTFATALMLSACVPDGAFVCEQDGQCSRSAGGVCQAGGRCSYPDPSCESGQRYSDYAGTTAGGCVPVGGGTATGTSTGSGGTTGTDDGTEGSESGDPTTGPLPDSCEGIDCSGEGSCVLVDDVATCACGPGLYPVGLSCREDPCDLLACHFVDAELGDDANDGSRELPWRTIARLEQAAAEAAPGEHFLLRRGRQWGEQLDLVGVGGALDRPLVVGAYGPRDEPAPRLLPGAVRISGAEFVTVRDLWIEDDPDAETPPNRPCVMIQDSEQVVIQGNTVTRCVNRGIRAHDHAAYVVIVDNTVRDVGQRAAIFVADADWDMKTIGPHHWIIDNLITGIPEDGIRVDASDVTGDLKVAGNVVADVTRTGISISAAGYAWALGNVVARAGDEAAAAGGGLLFQADGPVTGNVVMHSRYGISVQGTGPVVSNTVVHEGSGAALAVAASAEGLTITDDLLLARGGAPWVRLEGSDPADDVATMDLDWYASDDGSCLLQALGMDLDLLGFTMLTGFDAASSCGAVPGFGAVPSGLPPQDWDDAFWASLVPGAGWERCGAPAGARACDGSPLGDQPLPIAEYFEGGGLGWPGPLLVRQRYDTMP